ncbi:UNVERIFIED_CONTAM: hypothetical protein B566_EDAN017210 [Ephemera danica]|nr:hypothetical protein B566_EDAN017210 [Ephemera danica]
MDIETLELHGVSHILTVDSVPLPRSITQLSTVTNKFIQVTDNPREDLLTHFDDAVDFISKAMQDGVVLVHW